MSGNLFGNRADYSVELVDGVLCVIDHDNGRSVTNDAENVIADLKAAGHDLNTCRVIYRDTLGVWDELTVSNGTFSGFRSVNCKDRDEAIRKIKLN